LNQLFSTLALRSQAANEVMERAQRADPSAKETPENHGWNQDDQTPKKSAIQCVSREGVRKCHQGIDLKEKADGVGKSDVASGALEGAPELGVEQKKQKQ
jgi:hypothetical protein